MTDNSEIDERLASLIGMCASSDEEALSEIYRLTSAQMLAVQVRILGMNPMAERALHDTYARVWLKASEYGSHSGRAITWITSIARNHALNLRRALHNNRENDPHYDETAELSAELVDTAFLANNPAAEPLLSTLNDMDDKARVGIVTAYLDGLSLDDLSDVYNAPVESVRHAVHQGMLSLRGSV